MRFRFLREVPLIGGSTYTPQPFMLPWGAKVDDAFVDKLFEICERMGWGPDLADDLMGCMAFESGRTFRPDIRNAAGSGACVDTETEILTKRGWKRYDQVSIGDDIYSMDVATGKLVEDKIYDLLIKQSDHNYRMTSRSFDSVTTHDHRWYLLQRFYCRSDNTPEIVERTTEEMVELKSSHTYSVIHPGPHMVDVQDADKPEFPLEMYTLIGMIAGDGSINKERLKVELHCHSTCAPEELKEINKCISEIFPEGVACDTRGEMFRWRFNAEQSREISRFFDIDYNSGLDQSLFIKKLNPDFAASLNAKSAEALVYGYFVTDGHDCPSNGAKSFRSVCPEIVDDFMHAAVLAGYNPRSVTDYRGGTEHTFPNGRTYKIKDIHTVWLRKSGYTSASHAQMKKQRIDGELTVWCPTTGNRNWIARRGGTVYVTGNCGLIQFMPATARDLGTTTDALARMTAVEQLEYVYVYFTKYRWHERVRCLEDMYMAILMPKYISSPLGAVLFNDGTRAYTQNRGLDADQDGRITKAESAAKVRAVYLEGFAPGNAREVFYTES